MSSSNVLFLDEPYNYAVIVIYLVIIYSTLWLSRRKYFFIQQGTIKKVLAGHNLLLCLASVVMACGYAYNIAKTSLEFGFFGAYCGVSEDVDNRLYFWTNVFYLSKFYELFDTLFLVMERKAPIFLHVWHHTSVIALVCKSLQHRLLMSWLTGFLNSSVHIFMYYYYFVRSLGMDVWWRKYITKVQILQFIFDALTSLPFLFFRMSGSACSGTWESWVGGNFVGFSFLVLFIQFYNDSYKRKPTAASTAHAAGSSRASSSKQE